MMNNLVTFDSAENSVDDNGNVDKKYKVGFMQKLFKAGGVQQ